MALGLAYFTSFISLIFAATVFYQYLARRKPYQLVWSVGLLLWSVGAFLWFLREVLGISEPLFRLWYFTGAMLVPAYLGTGTLYLLIPRKVANIAMGLLVAVSALALAFVLPADLRYPLSNLTDQLPLSARDPVSGRSFFPPYVTIITILLNTYGTIALVGGALWSAWTLVRRAKKVSGLLLDRMAARRVTSNVLIAAGAFLSAAGGSLEALGLPQSHLLALLLGVVVIYVGFLSSAEVFHIYPVPSWLSQRVRLLFGRSGGGQV